MRLSKLRQFNVNGTTAAVANQPALSKPRNYWKTSSIFPFAFSQRDVYFSSLNRQGTQFDVDEVTFEAGATSYTVACALSPTLSVVAFVDGGDSNKGKVVAISNSGSTPTAGTAATFEAGATVDIDIKRVSATTFVISYIDDADSDNVMCRAGSVSGTTITLGTAVTVVASGSKVGTTVCVPRSGIVVVGYVLAGDGLGYCKGATISSTTIGTFTTAVNYETGATKYPNMDAITMEGNFVIVYQDDGAANDPITYRVGYVTEDGVCIFSGSATSMAGTAAAATLIKVKKSNLNEICVSWLDSGKGHVRCGTVSGESITFGDELEALSSSNTPATLDLAVLGSDRLALCYENDDVSDLGMVTLITKSGTTLSAGNTDVFAMAAVANVACAGLDGDLLGVYFMDDAASDVGNVIIGKVMDNLIDIRSEQTSQVYNGYMLHLNKSGLGRFAAYKITGTTNASANTAMGTKSTLPFNKWNNLICLFKDIGMYIEDDGTLNEYKSGISKANRTIDFRSTSTSVAFTAYVVKLAQPPRTAAF